MFVIRLKAARPSSCTVLESRKLIIEGGTISGQPPVTRRLDDVMSLKGASPYVQVPDQSTVTSSKSLIRRYTY